MHCWPMPRLPAPLSMAPTGLLAAITKSVLERALDVEIADHLGSEAGDPAGAGSGNSRNGHGRKTVRTTAGRVELEVPRDRNGSFEPVIVPKRKRRLGGVEDMILSLYALGISTRDITEHLAPRSTAPASRRPRSRGSLTSSSTRSPPGRLGRSILSSTSTRSASRSVTAGWSPTRPPTW